MPTVTSFTAERMQAIEGKAIAGIEVVGGHLIFTQIDGSVIDAGEIPTGGPGPPGPGGLHRVVYVEGDGYGARPDTEDAVLWINKINNTLPTEGGDGYVADLDIALVRPPS